MLFTHEITAEYIKTHSLKEGSTLDEIPDAWLVQYVNAHAHNDNHQKSIIKQLTGLSHFELLDLADDRKNHE
jgi:hypothetical protein